MKEVLRQYLEAFTRGDWEAFRACLTDDAVYEEECTLRRAQGPDEIIKTLMPWKEAFPEAKVRLKEAFESGRTLVAELEWEGTHSGRLDTPAGSFEPTGRRVKVAAVQVVRFENDKIAEVRHYFDLMTILLQLGVRPQAPEARPTP